MSSGTFFIATSWGSGAVAQHFQALAGELASRGNRVVILIDGQRRDKEDHLSNPAVYTWPSQRPTRLSDALFLRNLVKRYHPDCLIANFGSTNIMMLVGKLTRLPHRVVWYHTMSSAIDMEGERPAWQLALLRARKRAVYAASTRIIPDSYASLLDLQAVFGVAEQKCQVFKLSLADPFGADDSLAACSEVRNRVICVAGLTPWKGQDVLLESVAMLRRSGRDARVEFIGSGPLRESYERIAADSGIEDACSFVGTIDHKEVIRRIASASVLVLPSRSDNTPLAVVEALAVGRPVIASAVGGVAELVRDGVEGFLVPPDDPEVLAAKLETLLSDANLRYSMGRNARERFLQTFEQKVSISELANWCEQLVADQGTSSDSRRLGRLGSLSPTHFTRTPR